MRTGGKDTRDESESCDPSYETPTNSSEPSIEKPESHSKYRVINLATRAEFSGPYYGTDMYHPLDLILVIIDQVEIADQVEDISFIPKFNYNKYNGDGSDSAEYGEDDADDSDTELDRDTKVELAWPTMSTKLQDFNLEDSEEKRWKRALTVGNDAACFALLLCMVPNLRVLRLGGHCCSYKPWLHVASRFARSNPGASLSKLSSVDVQRNDDEFEEDINVLEELAFLPSLRNISADNMGGYAWEATVDTIHNQSNVEKVEIKASDVGIECMLQLLVAMRKPIALDFTIIDDDWEDAGCHDVKNFCEKFDEACGALIAERGLVWKAGVFRKDAIGALGGDLLRQGLMIRCAEFEHELVAISAEADK